MLYGTSFGVGEFIYKSVIPVTIYNIVSTGVFTALPVWVMYGRYETGLLRGLILVVKQNGHYIAKLPYCIAKRRRYSRRKSTSGENE